jgi:hypothetical protein
MPPSTALELLRGVVGELPERADALRLEQAGHPRLEDPALVHAELHEHAGAVADERQLVLPRLVLEAGERDALEDVVELRRLVAGRDERRGDRAGGGPGDALGDHPALP